MSRFERFDRRGSSDCDPVAKLGGAQDITAPQSSHLKLCRVVSSCCPQGCLSFQHFLLASSPSFFFFPSSLLGLHTSCFDLNSRRTSGVSDFPFGSRGAA